MTRKERSYTMMRVVRELLSKWRIQARANCEGRPPHAPSWQRRWRKWQQMGTPFRSRWETSSIATWLRSRTTPASVYSRTRSTPHRGSIKRCWTLPYSKLRTTIDSGRASCASIFSWVWSHWPSSPWRLSIAWWCTNSSQRLNMIRRITRERWKYATWLSTYARTRTIWPKFGTNASKWPHFAVRIWGSTRRHSTNGSYALSNVFALMTTRERSKSTLRCPTATFTWARWRRRSTSTHVTELESTKKMTRRFAQYTAI